MNIGFSGSRNWDDAQAALKTVKQIMQQTYEKYPAIQVHVGDAWGVDAMVVAAARLLFLPICIYGINHTWRNIDVLHGLQYPRAVCIHCDGGYLDRDRYLVDHIDLLIAIWNGTSRGTKYTYDYAVKSGKKAHLCTWGADGWKWS